MNEERVPTLEEVTGLIPLKEWADRLGLSRQWVYQLVWEGRIKPAAKLRHIILVPADMPPPERRSRIGEVIRQRLQRLVDEASAKAGERLVTQAELARRLGVSRQRVFQIIQARGIPVQRVPWDKKGRVFITLVPERLVKELRK
jgi:predicted DNA-binding transcriptional regulator AlpA